MKSPTIDLHRLTELDRTTWPEVRDRILEFTHAEPLGEPRSYPGYPTWPLNRCRPRPWPALERSLWARRSASKLATGLPQRAALSRLLQFSHGVSGAGGRGPTPSAGSLQALEMYVVNFSGGWLPSGVYHYDRAARALAQLAAGAERPSWAAVVPSLELIVGGALLWIIVGDGARVQDKYDLRAGRFLTLEAGHLMQNLCLMSQRVGCATIPLGAFFERDICRRLTLPESDLALYVGVCGKPLR